MQSSALNLKFYYVEALRWKTEAEFEPAGENLQPAASDIKARVQRDDDADDLRATAYRLTLSLEPNAGRFPYSFEIVLVGYFQLDPSISDDEAPHFLDANAPALLYGAAREALATSLGRGPFRPLILPTVHFLDLQRTPPEDAPSASPAALETATDPKPAAKKRTAKPRQPRAIKGQA